MERVAVAPPSLLLISLDIRKMANRRLISPLPTGTISAANQAKGTCTVGSGAPSQPVVHRDRWRRRLPYLAGGVVIILVVGWLLFTSIESATAPYRTVTELLAEGPSDRIVRATGTVVGETIIWDEEELVLQFDISDDGGSISIDYHGTRPDLLEDGTEAVVEGRYQGEGRFAAAAILLKCPSKYEEE